MSASPSIAKRVSQLTFVIVPKKARRGNDRLRSGNVGLHSAGDLAAAQAAGADVDVLGRTVHDGLDALHVRLPGTVGTTVRMADLDAEGHILVAELALCHSLKHLLARESWDLLNRQLIYNSRGESELQAFFAALSNKIENAGGGKFYARLRVKTLAKAAKNGYDRIDCETPFHNRDPRAYRARLT